MHIAIKGRRFNLAARHVALAVVLFVFGVIIPRLITVFVMGDGLTSKLGQDTEYHLLITSAVAGAIMLALGNAFLAHVLASRFNQRGGLWYALAIAWGLNLLFAVVLIAPALMVGLQRSPLAPMLEVWIAPLPRGMMQWIYCIVAVLVFDLLEAGAMAALAILSQDTQRSTTPMPQVDNTPVTPVTQDATPTATPDATPSARQRAWALLSETRGAIQPKDLAAQLSIPASTARSYHAQWRKEAA